MHIEAALPSTVVHVPALIILALRANHDPDSRKNRKGKKASGHMRSADNCVASMISNMVVIKIMITEGLTSL